MREMIKPGLVLCAITLVAAFCLGFVYSITLEPIARQKATTEAAAMQTVLPQAESFEPMEVTATEGSSVDTVSAGVASGEPVGYVIGTSPKGYAEDIHMLVAIDIEGNVLDVEITQQNETPGLGTKAKEPEFLDQYTGKNGEQSVTKSGTPQENEVDAITGATITSKAVTEGVNDALAYYNEQIKP